MRTIKKIMKYFIILFSVTLIPYSCGENFLYKEPPGDITVEKLNTVESIDKLLIGAYTLVDAAGVRSGWPSYAYAASPKNWTWDMASDDAAKGTTRGDWSAGGEVERYELLPTAGILAQKWMTLYDGVARTNDVLNTVKVVEESGIDFSESDKNNFIAQAMFLRGFYHFRIQRMWYQVPYISEDIEEPELVPNDGTIWDEIESDLQNAINHLPESWPGEPGRATKYAALAVKAYVHLHQNEYSEAIPLLDEIINSGKFELVENYYDNFNVAGENNIESIFELQASVNDGTGGYNGNPDSWTTNPYNPFVPTCCGMYQPTQDLVNAFQVDSDGLPLLGINGPKYNDENLEHDYGIATSEEFIPTNKPIDPRLDHTVGRRGVEYLGWGIHTGADWIRDQRHGGAYNTRKTMYHKSEQDVAMNSDFTRATGINWRMYRFAHVLLWRAECAVEENDLETARQLVNRVRSRASDDFIMGKVNTYAFPSGVEIDVNWDEPAANYLLGEYPSFPSQEYAREAVRMELRLETALEGNRFFDLRRWGIDTEVIPEFLANDTQIRDFLEGANYNEQYRYWPLPQNQIDLQPGILEQDPNH